MNATGYKTQIEADPSSSFWLKKAVVTAEGRDVLDALYDAELLLAFCKARAREVGVTG